MVAGTYNPGQPSAEGDDYTRADFTPAPSGSSTGNAFLVRMRRTNNTSGLDQEAWRQFRRSDAAGSVRPRQPDGAERR